MVRRASGHVIGEIGQPDFAVLSDMGMLCVTNGLERDLAEFDALFTAAGWRRSKTCPVGGYWGWNSTLPDGGAASSALDAEAAGDLVAHYQREFVIEPRHAS